MASLIEGILLLIISIVGLAEGIRLATQKSSEIIIRDILGPSFYIILLSLCLMVTSVVHLLVNYRNIMQTGRLTGEMVISGKVISMTAVFVVYILLMDFIGYIAASVPFFFLEFRIVGIRSWTRNVILTLVVVISFYILFVHYANMPLPRGIFR